ncbi:Hypothetical protein MexAM1_META2p1340 (plasmid) [Methylorubrum extorquens AM1]|uniref:Uncharacterized protein n=1 Tax=Methylorubrum extorquens (strain ATCC 14718 / DSM 1338 / JCM 2805 / NCIMB 9133 / AM1) TaxID=272630 RepID=C5B6J6_METEA|nr:Hypothetical protein MexAM1_META2p1340 [Methylorubrum extorquens AM1]
MEDLRLFVADMPGTAEDRVMPTVCRDWGSEFDKGSALALHGDDETETPRIPARGRSRVCSFARALILRRVPAFSDETMRHDTGPKV